MRSRASDTSEAVKVCDGLCKVCIEVPVPCSPQCPQSTVPDAYDQAMLLFQNLLLLLLRRPGTTSSWTGIVPESEDVVVVVVAAAAEAEDPVRFRYRQFRIPKTTHLKLVDYQSYRPPSGWLSWLC